MLDENASRHLADRFRANRLPRRASILMMSAGMITAAALVFAAGNQPQKPTIAVVNGPTPVTPQASRAAVAASAEGAMAYGRAIAAMRGTIDLAAARQTETR